ncbi:MarR family winged helix-turn-helix transcriptional regulator [Eoetvoesiella caeni]|nr:MarR family transcriptional regulator [Eoetvoesiella caeni]
MESSRAKVHRAHLGSVLRRLYQKNQALFAELSVDPTITSTQTAALCALHEEGPLCLTDLGMATAMDLATMRGVVARLRRSGLVTLAGDPSDKRRVIVSLCQKGADYVARMQPVFIQLDKKSFEQRWRRKFRQSDKWGAQGLIRR